MCALLHAYNCFLFLKTFKDSIVFRSSGRENLYLLLSPKHELSEFLLAHVKYRSRTRYLTLEDSFKVREEVLLLPVSERFSLFSCDASLKRSPISYAVTTKMQQKDLSPEEQP